MDYMSTNFGAQAVLLLECRQTDKQTDKRDWMPYPAAYTAGVGNDRQTDRQTRLNALSHAAGYTVRMGNDENLSRKI